MQPGSLLLLHVTLDPTIATLAHDEPESAEVCRCALGNKVTTGVEPHHSHSVLIVPLAQ